MRRTQLAAAFACALGALVAAQPPPAGAGLDPSTFRYARAIGSGRAGLVVLPLDAAVLAHSRGPQARFADVRVVDAQNRQLPYLLVEGSAPMESALMFGTVHPAAPELQSTEGHHRSTYLVVLPYARLPEAHLVLDTSARTFRRDVQLSVGRPPDRRRRDRWADVIGVSEWQHANESVAAPPLELIAGNRDATDLLVTIDEGDNAPLPLTAVRLWLPAWRIRFYRPADTPLRLLYGSRDAVAPEYDLALLRTTVMGESAEEVSAAPEPAPPKGRAAIVSPRIFWGFLIAAVLVLAALIARLATSRSSEDPSPPSAPRP